MFFSSRVQLCRCRQGGGGDWDLTRAGGFFKISTGLMRDAMKSKVYARDDLSDGQWN